MNAISKPGLAEPKSLNLFRQPSKIRASQTRNDVSLITKKGHKKTPRRLIRISTSDGRWHGKWNLDYTFSLHDLQLQDLTEELMHKDNEVSIALCIQKHTGFGLSVEGKIITSFTRKCSNCSSPFCREIDTNFNVWVLPSSKQKSSDHQLPEIGGDDPSVIYVKPGDEVNFDSLIRDTIRLATAVKETCSEACEKSEPVLQYDSEAIKADRRKRGEDEVLCRGHILDTLSDRLYDVYKSMKTLKEIWDALEYKYNTQKQVNSCDWWYDFGAIVHVCNDKSVFKTYEDAPEGHVVLMGNHDTAKVHGIGVADLHFISGKKLVLVNVLHVPDMRKNLCISK